MAARTSKQLEELRENRKNNIMQAALYLFSSKGYSATSMDEVAKASKISKGNIYNYFSGKEQLLKEIIGDGFKIFFDFLEREHINEMTDELLEKYVRFSMNSFVNNYNHWKVYFSLIMQAEVSVIMEAEIWEMAIPFMGKVQAYFEKKGSINAMVETRTLFAVLDGIGVNYIVDPKNFPLEDSTQMIIDKFIYNKQ